MTVTAATLRELRQQRDTVQGADLVELRLDTVSDPDVAGALRDRRGPVVLTCRPLWEGGAFAGSEEERHRLLAEAVALGAEYVDVEWASGFDDVVAARDGRGIVLSSHHFDGMPSDLASRASAMRGTGAEVVKLAATVHRLSDCVTLRDAARQAGRSVFIGMGEPGLATRVLASRLGSAWTYAGQLAGVGQITLPMLLEEYGFARISADTKVYGLVGSPIAHSVSPAMHNAAFREAGIEAVYLPVPAADPDDFLTFADAFGVAGASVTIPFKVALFARVREASEAANATAALNTLKRSDAGWLGHNTDVAGFLSPLTARAIDRSGWRVAVLGAGGSARAVCLALREAGADVTVYARDADRAGRMTAQVGARVAAWPVPAGTWDLLVNCTPVGMHPQVNTSPVPVSALTGRVVYDLVYNPPVTRLLREAEEAGCRIIGGLDMLVAQAQEQFSWWTSVAPSAAIMRAAALRRLSEFTSDAHHLI